MLTLKRLTTVWKYATALPEDQTAATLSNCFSTYLNSRNIALQATRVKGAVLKKKINELTVLRVVNLYQPQTRSMGGPFMLVNNSNITARSRINQTNLPEFFICFIVANPELPLHYRRGLESVNRRAASKTTHLVHEIQSVACTIVIQQLGINQ